LHFFFFHSCLNENSFEHRDRLLIHTEYPMPFKVRKGNVTEIEEDNKRAMRPHIDSILLNKNFIDWILDGNEIGVSTPMTPFRLRFLGKPLHILCCGRAVSPLGGKTR